MEIVKKAIATIAIVLMILTSSMTIAVTNQKGKVTTDTLRLRKEASLESTVLELIYKDEEVEIIGEEGNWYKVKFKAYTGYVSKEFISKNKEVNTNNNENNANNSNNNENVNNNNTNQNGNTENNNTNNEQNVNKTKNDKLANKKATLNSDLDVYILPLINSNIIAKLKQNTKVDIVSITGVWTYIKTEELAGWIRLDKISVIDENTESNNSNSNSTVENAQNTNNEKVNEQNNNTTEESNSNNNQTDNNQANNNTQTNTNNDKALTPKNYYIKSSAVNVREKSTTSSNIVTTLTQNTQVKVVAEQSDWYKVEYNGKTGYILKSLLSEKKVEVTTRSSEQERDTEKNTSKDTKKTTSNTKKEEEATSYNSSKGEQVVAYAKNYLGCRYVYGGSGPKTFDCSGFTMYVYKKFGFSLPHSAVTQARVGKYVSKSNLQPGDLIIFNNSANTSIGHVGIYVGGGNFIHASSGGGRIMISSLSGSYYKARYVTARRLV